MQNGMCSSTKMKTEDLKGCLEEYEVLKVSLNWQYKNEMNVLAIKQEKLFIIGLLLFSYIRPLHCGDTLCLGVLIGMIVPIIASLLVSIWPREEIGQQ